MDRCLWIPVFRFAKTRMTTQFSKDGCLGWGPYRVIL